MKELTARQKVGIYILLFLVEKVFHPTGYGHEVSPMVLELKKLINEKSNS